MATENEAVSIKCAWILNHTILSCKTWLRYWAPSSPISLCERSICVSIYIKRKVHMENARVVDLYVTILTFRP